MCVLLLWLSLFLLLLLLLKVPLEFAYSTSSRYSPVPRRPPSTRSLGRLVRLIALRCCSTRARSERAG